MEGKVAFDLIKPCSITIQRLSVYYGESKIKKLYRKTNNKIKTVVASKRTNMAFLEKNQVKANSMCLMQPHKGYIETDSDIEKKMLLRFS